MKKSEIRKSYLLNKSVIISPGRAKRPWDTKKPEANNSKDEQNCPFCPQNIDRNNIIDKIKRGKKWQVLSIKNIFPAVSPDNSGAYGYQEVLIETPNHRKELSDLGIKDILDVLKMYSLRSKKLAKDKKINYILCFKNHGIKAGASKAHSHSQLFASEITPQNLQEEALALKNYKDLRGTCAYCDIIKKEIKSKRKVAEDEHFAAFTPYASEYHYELWFFSKRHVDNINLLSKKELESLAKMLKMTLNKLKITALNYNLFLHNVINDDNQHFYIKLQPRGSVWAGLELGSGLVINSVSPEEAAEFYKK